MSDKCFLDTNIFIYSFDRDNPQKQEIAKKLISDTLQNGTGIISYQVIQEFLNVATRKFKTPFSIPDCQRYISVILEPMCEVFSSIELYHHALEIMETWRYSFYDSLIISAAIKADCSLLHSEDLQNGQKIKAVEIINPFISTA